MSDEPRPFLSVREVAQLLGVTTDTIYNLIWRKQLPSVRVGTRAIRIHRDSLKQVVNAGFVPPGALKRFHGKSDADTAAA